LKKLRRLPQWIRNRLNLGGAVLLYHRVAARDHDPHGNCVTPEHFDQQLAFIGHTMNVVALDELARRVREGRRTNGLVAITFDDGYEDNLTQALPLLEKHSVPATFFIINKRERAFWWDRLETMDSALYGRLQRLSYDDQHRELDQMGAKNDSPARLSDTQIAAAARHDLITIGAHTVTHPALSSLTPERQRGEIADSKKGLEEITGRPVRGFAYPYGTPETFDSTTVRLVRQCGFDHASTAFADVASAASDVYRLPRFAVRDHDDLGWLTARYNRGRANA
jgi:peptidoglycan/xylan/chitin deacetylase (PgdA/CDA1 family)